MREAMERTKRHEIGEAYAVDCDRLMMKKECYLLRAEKFGRSMLVAHVHMFSLTQR